MLLEKYFKQEKLPSFYAEKLNITLKHLNRICNEILQKTATEVIMDRVILEIKRMLIDKQLAVNEVAFAVGAELRLVAGMHDELGRAGLVILFAVLHSQGDVVRFGVVGSEEVQQPERDT